ncbi:gluconolactonase [Rhizobium leguminosarum]|uniref:SMP-30/gluconolactonase/LRE family protein n=1 Tax=Rhizobium leguminosarum TaxID=384 RepID=UPI001AE42B56|nr:SMP-30/gluconolactonase/LRE family protein [Rhizobium leguminosarum]MBP2490838.1 gluconolactonase [Rhizobium leguminosarum]
MPKVDVSILARGLRFPEGPVAMSDGSVFVVELSGKAIKRISSDGEVSIIVDAGGSPNGMAVGPDGALYICNNGGLIFPESHFPSIGIASDYRGGFIQRLDLKSYTISELYTHCEDRRLSAPNDLVFDSHGGFYFTDLGKRHSTHRDHGGVYYAKADGSLITRVIYPLLTPNGIGLSPDGNRLYVADTETARLYAYDIRAPGKIDLLPFPAPYGATVLVGLPGYQRFDSLAVDQEGNICIATLGSGTLTVVSPSGELMEQIEFDETYPTNVCFGGPNNHTAYVTLSETGRLVSFPWRRPGLKLNFNL